MRKQLGQVLSLGTPKRVGEIGQRLSDLTTKRRLLNEKWCEKNRRQRKLLGEEGCILQQVGLPDRDNRPLTHGLSTDMEQGCHRKLSCSGIAPASAMLS
jgi:hypothetical protein